MVDLAAVTNSFTAWTFLHGKMENKVEGLALIRMTQPSGVSGLRVEIKRSKTIKRKVAKG
jgi:hypothetical protein